MEEGEYNADMLIKTFEDLETWQEGRKLTRGIYETTKQFLREELFGLISQMRRAAVSVIANVAEGFGRVSIKEKLHFYSQSHGSLLELESHVLIRKDLKFLGDESCEILVRQIRSVQSLLNGLIRSTKSRL